MSTDAYTNWGRRPLLAALFCALLFGCGSEPSLYGAPVSIETLQSTAVELSAAQGAPGEVAVRGEIGRVCEVGCWFYLMGDAEMVYVKLDLASGLVIPVDSQGKRVLAVGEFVGEGASAEFKATTVVLY